MLFKLIILLGFEYVKEETEGATASSAINDDDDGDDDCCVLDINSPSVICRLGLQEWKWERSTGTGTK